MPLPLRPNIGVAFPNFIYLQAQNSPVVKRAF